MIWANDSSSSSSDKKQSQALADVDASLMQRLDQEGSNNHRLLEAIKAAQVSETPDALYLSSEFERSHFTDSGLYKMTALVSLLVGLLQHTASPVCVKLLAWLCAFCMCMQGHPC